MLLWTRVSLGSLFAATAVAATVMAWHRHRDSPPPRSAQVIAVPVPQILVAQTEEPPVSDEGGDEPVGYVEVASAGDVDLALVPAGYVRALAPEKTGELIAFVNSWIGDHGIEPAIEYRKGVVFAHSREDRGDDGPYPRSAEPEGERVCGTKAVWMRDALSTALQHRDLVCAKNVCWYGGMEYAPDGYLVFHPTTTVDNQQTWALDAWVEVYDRGLADDLAAQNRADVTRMMKGLESTSCPGEPAGAY